MQEASRRIHQIINLLDKQDKNLKISYTMDEKLFLIDTSYFRELVFNFEHCIHHQAFIRIAIDSLINISLPENFGVSPSTIANRKTICVQ